MTPSLSSTLPPTDPVRDNHALLMALDESFRDDVAVVGGLILPAAHLPDLEAGWRNLKRELGMTTSGELKYNVPSGTRERGELDAAGNTVRVRQPKIAQFIAQSGVVLLAEAVYTPGESATPDRYYLDGFRWAVERFANHVQYEAGTPAGPHTVLTDMPPSPPKLTGAESDHVRRLFADPTCAAQAVYREMALDGPSYLPPLVDLGFAGGLQVAKSAYCDVLQIADFVVGCVRDFVVHAMQPARFVGAPPEPSYRDDLLAALAPAFRRAPGGSAASRGFDVFPRRDLQSSAVRRAVLGVLDAPPRQAAA